MMYNVTVNKDMQAVAYFPNLSKSQAIKTAQAESVKGEGRQVFISWHRESDGQQGFLNPDGNHAITGKTW
jgi:hypothetical protein